MINNIACHRTTATDDFLRRTPLSHFINGKWDSSDDFKTTDVINPSNGTVLASVALGGEREIDRAVWAAHRAFASWSKVLPLKRAVLIHRLANRLKKNKDVLAELESLNVGEAIVGAEGFDIPFDIESARYYADLVVKSSTNVPLIIKNIKARVHLAPYGVCGFIFPWNFPFDLFLWETIPALAAGNTVVVKPSEITPLSSLYISQLATEVGFPNGVINVVVGTGSAAGAALVRHPLVRRIAFTAERPVCYKKLSWKGLADRIVNGKRAWSSASV